MTDKPNKQKIAEILYNIPTNMISTDDIRFIMSYLPDETTERGTNSVTPSTVTFDHTINKKLHLAIGMQDADVIALARKLQNSFMDDESPRTKKTQVLEKFYPQLNEKEKVLLIAEGVPAFQFYSTEVALESEGAGGIEKILGADSGIGKSELNLLAEKLELVRKLLRAKRKSDNGE